MKKFTQAGKKALSVFLAALMVMTAWVFVAPEKAEAANGSYWLNVKVDVTNKADKKESIQDSYWNITYRPNNGRGNEATMKYDLKENEYGVLSNESNNQYMHVSVPGFPTKIYYYHDATWNDKVHYTVREIYISSSNTNGGVSVSQPNKAIKSGGWGNSEVEGNFSWDEGSKYPYVATSKSISTATAASNIGIPPLGDKKDVSTSTTTMQYYTTDQYGVRYEPTSYTFSGVTGLTTSGSIGNAYTVTANSSTTVSKTAIYQTETVKLNWKNDNSSNTSQHGNSTYTFKVYNPRYKVTYSGNGGTLGTNYTYAYLNQKVSADSSTATSNNVAGLTAEKFPTTGSREGYKFNGIWSAASGGTQYSADTKVTKNSTAYAHWTPIKYNAEFRGNRATYPAAVQEYLIANVATDFDSRPVAPTNVEEYDEGDYHYTFNGKWKNSAGNVYEASSLPIMTTAGARYEAQYNVTFVQADYSGVVAQKNEAARIKSNPNYEAIYTQSSRDNLQAALDAVVTGKGRTQQDVVDGYAQRIKDAIEALEGQKYSVVFMDGRDNSIIKFSYPNVFGDAIQYPANPSMSHDKNYHYTFKEWVGSAQETNLSTVEKNLTVIAKFNKTAHNYTQQHIDSNCVAQGGTKYTCTVCGYSYMTYSGSYGKHTWSTEWTTDIEPTCTQPGSKSHHCTLCEARKDETAIPALGHDYAGVDPEIIISSSCDSIGVSIKECNRCGYNDYITTDPIGHKMTDEVTAPTCTSKGYTISTCEVCGKMLIGSFTDPIAHNYVKNSSECVASSCVGIGYDVSYCSVCGLKKYDIIYAKGHSWNKEQTVDIEPTCTTKGQKSIHCSVCDVISADTIEEIPANGHSYDIGEVLAPATCTQNGVKAYHCTVSGCGHTKTESIAKLGHSWNTDFTTDISATCKSAGVKSKHCSRCDARTDVTVIPALPHIWNTGVETTAATCTTDGVKTYTCASCNTTKTEVIPKLGHNFVAGKPVAATCKSSGYIPYTCTNGCSKSYKVINGDSSIVHDWNITTSTANGKTTVSGVCIICGATFSKTVDSAHNFKNITTNNPATCLEKGLLVIACADTGCNETLSVELPVNPDAHSAIKTTVTNPTCTEKGKVTTVCTSCNKAVAAEQTIPAKGHSFSGAPTNYVAPTCKTEGSVTYTCTVSGCGATKTDTIPVNPNAHKFIQKANGHHDATCTTPAYDEYVCEYGCGETYNKYDGGEVNAHVWKFTTSKTGTTLTVTCKCKNCDASHTQTIDVAEGHNYVNAAVTKQPTCTEEGAVTIACDKAHDANCTSVVTATLPVNPKAHSGLKTTVTPATCETNGTATTVCESCGNTIGESATIAALGHNYVDGEETVITAATCENDGKKTVKCTRCTNTMETVIPKTGHSWDGGTLHAADCTHGAYTTYKCSNCNKTYDAVAEGAKALGHDWNDWVIVNPTNDTAGSAMRTCKRCNEPERVEIKAQGHKFDASKYTETEATCTAKGSRTYTCTAHENCGVSVTVDTDFAPHSYELKYNEKATCTKDGKVVMECSVCHDSKEIVIPKFGHTWNEGVVTTPATCKAEGVKTFTCSTCNETRTETIEKLPHNFIAGKEVPPTCKDGGKSGYIPYTCSCGESYVKLTDKKIEHKFSSWKTVQEANESRIGIEKRTCSECGAVDYRTTDSTGDHQYTETITKNPTCTEEGSKTLTCTNPNHTGEEPQVVPIPALGHDMKAGESVAATCEHEGYTDYTCSRDNCDFTYRIITAPASGHTASEWTEVVPATCTVDGVQKQTCTTCGKILAEKTIPAPGHSNKIVTQEASCFEPSVTYTYCTKCNTIDGEVTVGNALGHNFVEDVDQYVAPTNSKNGKKVLKCSRCDATITVTIPAQGHKFELVSKVDATCEKTGLETYKCTTHTGDNDCGLSYTNVIPMKAHTYETRVKTKPTCTTDGVGEYYCSVCNEVFGTYEIPALGHDFSKETANVASTCNTVGYVTKQCSRCDETETTYSSTLADHKWGDWETVQTADETHPGIKVRKCSVCDLYQYETEPPTGEHDYDDGVVTKQPTCTEPGIKKFTCRRTHCACTPGNEKSYTVEIAPTGHKAKIDKKDATCSEAGYIKVVCETCGATIGESITLEKKKHIYQSTVTIEPTCSKEGVRTYTCALCGDSYTEAIATISHDYQPTGRTVAPTCTTEGFDVYKCTYCGKETFVKTAEKLGHTERTVTIAATCTEKGSTTVVCSVCNTILKETEYTPALGHDWGEWKVTVPGTCEVEGKKTRECSRCHETETISTGTGEHVYPEKGVVTPATCTADGYTTYTCTVCNKYSVIRDYTPKLGHKYSADYKIIVEPTCHSTGTKAHYCVRCGAFEPDYLHNYVELPKLAHTYGEWVVTTEPTCDTNGVKTRTCTGCTDKDEGHTQTELIGKKGHNYGEWEITKKSTCVEEGSQRRYCDRCKTWEVQVTPKGGHNRVADYAVEATCTAPGKTAGSHCSICGYVFVAQQEVPMKEHMDLNGDGRCEGCGKTMYSPNGETDSCLCHGTGFRAFIYKIVLIIWKIFKINKDCVCGAKHY